MFYMFCERSEHEGTRYGGRNTPLGKTCVVNVGSILCCFLCIVGPQDLDGAIGLGDAEVEDFVFHIVSIAHLGAFVKGFGPVVTLVHSRPGALEHLF